MDGANNVIISGSTSTYSHVQSVLNSNRPANSNANNNSNNNSVPDAYSSYVQSYIDSFSNKEKNTEILGKLKLTEDDNKLLENYLDPIYFTVINVPVRLNDHVYDLNTLVKIYQESNTPKDPFNMIPFTLRDIQAARDISEGLGKVVQTIKTNHQNVSSSNKIDPPTTKCGSPFRF